MNAKIVTGVILIVAALAYLILGGLKDTAVYYMTLPELYAKEQPPIGLGMRISGPLLPGSIQWDAEKIELRFSLAEGVDTLHVIHNGAPPDQMSHADNVVVEGELLESGDFLAQKLLLKCPSKYEVKKSSEP